MVELFIINFNLRENKNMDTIMTIVFLISFVGIQVCEPAQPKKDKRFKTGYKNNERPRKQTETEAKVQNFFMMTGGISLIYGLIILFF